MLKKLWAILTPHERGRARLVVAMMLIMALLDALGVASILPFIAVLSNPGMLESNTFLRIAFDTSRSFGVNTEQQFLFFLGLIVLILLVISLAFKALTTYAQTRFCLLREYSIGKRLVEGYLRQPYSWFLDRHSANLGATILSEVSTVISSFLTPLMSLLAQAVVSAALLTLLVIADPLLAINSIIGLGLAYGGVFVLSNRLLRKLGYERGNANRDRFAAVNEAFGAVKEVKVSGLEQFYIQRFAAPAEVYAKRHTMARVISQMPRFALEAVAFGGILLIVLYFMKKSGGFEDALPLIALYSFAGYRLLPAVQQIYGALTQMRFAEASLETVHRDLMDLSTANIDYGQIVPKQLTEAIHLSKVSYRYPNARYSALKNLELTIPVHNRVGIVGATGSGKTTAVDVILGLLQPQEGELIIDGKPIYGDNFRQWRRAVGYVPQQMCLVDASVAANIAFGVNPEHVNQSAIERAAKIANLHDYVINDLPQGYSTKIGESGVRLSGGQRQRIAIARALYRSPQVLILDEATSALDNLTEHAVMDALNNLDRSITIIMIAHRLSTVRNCDQIYLLDRGEVKAQGTYDDLINTNEQFRLMTASY